MLICVHQNTSQGITESEVRELEKYLTRYHRVGCQGAREISLIKLMSGKVPCVDPSGS